MWYFVLSLVVHRRASHCHILAIHSVTVASHNAEFSHHDPLLNISFANATDAQDCHRHPELKRKIYSALQEGDEGELSIVIPREVSLRASANDPLTGFSFNEGGPCMHCLYACPHMAPGTPEPQTPGVSQSQATAGTDLTPIVVKIDYSLRNPVDGVEFVIPNEALPYVRFHTPIFHQSERTHFHSAFHIYTLPPPRLTLQDVGFPAWTTNGKSVLGSLSLWSLATWRNTILCRMTKVISIQQLLFVAVISLSRYISLTVILNVC